MERESEKICFKEGKSVALSDRKRIEFFRRLM
jgi:hypothetical protein